MPTVNKYRPPGLPENSGVWLVRTRKEKGILSSGLPVCIICKKLVGENPKRRVEMRGKRGTVKNYHLKCLKTAKEKLANAHRMP